MMANQINNDLYELYSEAWDDFGKQLPKNRGLTNPHFLKMSDEQLSARFRVMVVGQQTGWWCDDFANNFLGSDPVGHLMTYYSEWMSNERYKNRLYFQAARSLFHRINPTSPRHSFIWVNLIKCAQKHDGNKVHYDRPDEDLVDKICSVGLLEREIQIIQPHVVVFFLASKYYHERLMNTLRDTQSIQVEKSIRQIIYPPLPKGVCFNTYHPQQLRRTRQWEVLEKIAGRILSALPSSSPP